MVFKGKKELYQYSVFTVLIKIIEIVGNYLLPIGQLARFLWIKYMKSKD